MWFQETDLEKSTLENHKTFGAMIKTPFTWLVGMVVEGIQTTMISVP